MTLPPSSQVVHRLHQLQIYRMGGKVLADGSGHVFVLSREGP